MLNLVAPIVGDEPVAAPAPKLDRAAIDRREINRRCVKYWATIHPMIFDQRGKPIGCAHLNPAYRPNPDGQVRYGEPRLAEFSGLDPRENEDSGPGAWQNRSNSASGKDAISLIEWAGQCDRKTATTFLKDLTDRLVELPK